VRRPLPNVLQRALPGTLQKTLHGLALGLGAGLLAWLLGWAGLLEGWENLTWSWRARALAAPSAATARVKLIAVDQDSLDWASRENGLSWPWPRQVYAPILNFCARAGAKAVALDIIFSEPSPLIGDDEDLGQALAQALAVGTPSVGAVMLGRATGAATAWPPGWEAKTQPLDGLAGWAQGPGRDLVMPRALLPVEPIARGLTALANVMEEPDPDQVVRRVTPLRAFAGHGLLSLGLAGACLPGDCSLAGDKAALVLKSRAVSQTIPLDEQGRAILRYRGGPGTHQKLSAAAVIRSALLLAEGRPPEIDPAALKDAFVLLGLTAPGLHDLRATPLAALYPGLEVHATALDNLLAGDFLRPAPGWALGLSALLMGLAGGLAGGLASRAWQSSLAFLALAPLPALAGLAAYQAGWWWPVAAPTLAAALALVGAVVLAFASEGRQRRFIKRAFRHYLSPEVIERLLAEPGRLSLGGERRELTIFFADLQGFTAIGERLDPHDLAALLNDYLSEMTEEVLAQGGTLDKYEGDAIVAFWNAPLDQPDHALRACRAALGCQARLARRRADYAARAGAPLFMRVGVNSGPVVVGNLGSRTRFDYTVLGDAANLASRLEGANKLFGTGVMVSESTWTQANAALPGGALAGRELGLLRVKGRAAPVRVYEPLDEQALLEAASDTKALAAFAQGLALVRARNWAAAAGVFAGLAGDPAAAVYAGRCRERVADPGPDWDGVWELAWK
jgi:adenylate cyclase